jgi:hypothetical protein
MGILSMCFADEFTAWKPCPGFFNGLSAAAAGIDGRTNSGADTLVAWYLGAKCTDVSIVAMRCSLSTHFSAEFRNATPRPNRMPRRRKD